MKIIVNRFIPFGRYRAMAIWPFVFIKRHKNHQPHNWCCPPELIFHEFIHFYQQKELLFIFFYLIYLLEFLFNLIRYRNWDKAYRNISFEREAYDQQGEYDYGGRRKP